MFARASLVAAMICVTGAPLAAQTAAPPDDSGRYGLQQVRAGYLRLDRQTGAVSLCRERGDTWTCELVADDRAAYDDSLAVLEAENAELKARVASLEARLEDIVDLARRPVEAEVAVAAPDAPVTPDDNRTSDQELAENEAEMDRALDFTEDAMRRLFGLMREFQRDMEPADDGTAQ